MPDSKKARNQIQNVPKGRLQRLRDETVGKAKEDFYVQM